MSKIILITGATDGIGLETAKMLVSAGHHVLLHGRNPTKLKNVEEELSSLSANAKIESYVADLSDLHDVKKLAEDLTAKHSKIDVLINNAGVYKTPNPRLENGQDIRFVVNTLAPYLLTQNLLPLLGSLGRVINLSSAAQAPVDLEALLGEKQLADGPAYAQSKLAITMWSRHMAEKLTDGPVIIAVNPGSLLGSKMVKDAFGIDGGDISIGADILVRSALDEEFADKSGQYFDNDSKKFAPPHPDALDNQKTEEIVQTIENVLAKTLPSE